jgi:hypothetical protein
MQYSFTQFKKALVLIGIFLITMLGCKKDKIFCGCGKENPIKNIEWLNSSVKYYDNDTYHNWSEVNLYMYDYKNSNAFIFEAKEIGLYDVPTSIYDCDGRTIFVCGGLQPPQLDSCNIFFQSATNKTLIWSKR